MAAGGGGQGGSLGRTAAVGEEEFHDQAKDGEGERPLITFEGDLFHAAFQFVFGYETQLLTVDGVESFRSAAHRDVKPVGGFSDFPQRGLVEFGGDRIAGLVPDEIAAAVGEVHRDGDAGGAAYAHGVNGHALFGLFPGGIEGIALQVFPIRDENKNAVIVALFVEEPRRFIDGAGHVRALFRDEIRIQRVEGFPEGIVVAGEGTERVGAAGERDQSHAVAFEAVNEVVDAKPGAFQSVRAEVFGQHAAGSVHGE